ncbi:unnamed protein product [Protopolystoma xenopodis]|uniref:Uncharacterized protein n=1 Tax=Protopolystoma xenopodis TaxID=117903 RepID=A0A3S5AID2_9PLAT|nr:unnamed protein product [Protopolystoma xenopodis]
MAAAFPEQDASAWLVAGLTALARLHSGQLPSSVDGRLEASDFPFSNHTLLEFTSFLPQELSANHHDSPAHGVDLTAILKLPSVRTILADATAYLTSRLGDLAVDSFGPPSSPLSSQAHLAFSLLGQPFFSDKQEYPSLVCHNECTS